MNVTFGLVYGGSKNVPWRPMMFESIPDPEMSLPISSTIRRSICSNGSRAIQLLARRRSSRSPASRSAGRNAWTTAVSSYPFSTTPSPKAIRAFRSTSRPKATTMGS